MDVSELFDICATLAANEPTADASRQLHEVLALTCAEGCRQQGGAFGNLFSQVDFLGKRLAMSAADSRELQTARRHTNNSVPVGSPDWLYDVRAVARLVSAVFSEDVPGKLLRLLPATARQEQYLQVDRAYVRCIVRGCDDHYLYAATEDDDIAVDYLNTTQGRDFTYLQRLVRAGMQMNLLDVADSPGQPVTRDGLHCFMPGQIIVEPDFLIDISALAACFTNYGHHPLLYTVNRFSEHVNSQAMLLGNFAGAALDEIISNPEVATADVLRRSFSEQVLRFCACSDFDAGKFKKQAEQQMANIREAVAALGGKLHGALLEPSFVCERLGLQGRVDLMTSDLHLLVEQKSGRNMKIEYQSHDKHGLQIESHYVQLLLYYGVLHYNFGVSDRQVDTRLLYSRYPAAQGLLTVNYYRTLLRDALKLRNQIVATELLIAREGIQRILPLLNADVIYKDVARDSYFHRYVLPSINNLQAQLAVMRPLERAYLERMLTFVYREQVAAKLGSSEARLHHSGGCTADLWQMSLSEKEETGNILMGTVTEATAQRVTLTIQPGATPNFRMGDMVSLYICHGEPDVRTSILYKGTLQKLTADSVTVELNNSQQHDGLFSVGDGRQWAVEHADSDIVTSSNIRALYRFATASQRRRDLLLGQRVPETDSRRQLTHSYHRDYDDVLLRICQARDYFLLVGPPGTGKTSMALRFIVQEELAAPHAAALLTAYTNRAVDEICAMLSDAGLPFLRLGRATSCDERYHSHLADRVLAEKGNMDAVRQTLDDTPVIVATTSTLQAQPYILELKHFTLAVVDEASQILEPSVIGLLASDSIDRFVLVGDHKQLPAVVQQDAAQTVVAEQCLRDIGLEDCRQSLFERLLRCEHRSGRTQMTGTLHTHGRMHPEVALFPLRHFYQREQLRAVPLPHQQAKDMGYGQPAEDNLDVLLKTRRVLFVGVPSDQQHPEEAEARLVADLLHRLHRLSAPDYGATTVGVIVPYRQQIALIRQAMTEYPELSEQEGSITIDTVERYQGSQRDVIIYSFGISHLYQLDFLTATTFADEDGTLVDRKLNVALTRARRQMIATGRPDLLCRVPLFSQLMTDYAAG